ncbi:hypothetical protein WS72_13540 [Burkholderia savannae]|uniref:Integrase catalytic domain-containing protein n=1 Tax=Burkholderia savannae TaxID=1637837 RepID=A0ABR5TFL3_9BURK|nr:hypothetical protein WS72_13540 [Burkholderia savannae]
MLAAIGHRFSNAQMAAAEIEWLTDNGSGYTVEKVCAFAADIGLRPLTPPVSIPQSNDMAESFVKTMKPDVVLVFRSVIN